VSFRLNRKEIAKTLCVKKDEPTNCCQGSCHLKKQLQAEEKKEQSPSSPVKSIKQVQLFCQQNTLIQFSSYVLSEKAFTPFHVTETTSFPLSVFHPPCLT